MSEEKDVKQELIEFIQQMTAEYNQTLANVFAQLQDVTANPTSSIAPPAEPYRVANDEKFIRDYYKDWDPNNSMGPFF